MVVAKFAHSLKAQGGRTIPTSKRYLRMELEIIGHYMAYPQ